MRNLCWRLGVVLSSLLASVTTASFAHDDHAPRITRADAIGDLTKNAPVTLFIHGHGFGVGRTPAVKLGDLSTVTQSGSPATPDLTVSSYSTTDIVATINHPVDSKLMPASYPLRVLTFQKRHGDRGEGDDDDRDAATFDVTIGAVGPKGDKGDNGAIGLPGKDGKDGAPGATGPKGNKGDKGDKGAAGANGATGPKGDTGATGPQGIPGNLALAGQVCPPGSQMMGFEASGKIKCNNCTPLQATFAITAWDDAIRLRLWPGGSSTFGPPSCNVTVAAPSRLIRDQGDTWTITSQTGFTSCTVSPLAPMCSYLLPPGNLEANGRPTCSSYGGFLGPSFAQAIIYCY